MARALNNNTLEIEEDDEKFREKLQFLINVLPDASPVYLEEMCNKYYEDDYSFQRFIRSSLKHRNYPSKKDYERSQELSKQKMFYTENFSIEKFLEIIPNPEEYFSEKNNKRINRLKYINAKEKEYIRSFLKIMFSQVYVKNITKALEENTYDLIKTVETLKKCGIQLKKKRSSTALLVDDEINIELLQEIAYVKRRTDILTYLKDKEQEKRNTISNAKKQNLLNVCECCFDDEILPEETITCEKGHKFCIQCTKTGCEVMLEQGKLEFPCLTTCDNFFNIFSLQNILKPSVFSRIYKSQHLKEIQEAIPEDIENCPHCEFAAIVSPNIRIFSCLNPECLKETCRLCRQPSHVPLRCDQVEKPEEIKERIFIEDKMTEALIRSCYKCNTKFLKEDGCNKMTCPCGASMCYVCKEPVKDYSHFNGEGGDRYDLCPLFSNTDKLHAENVLDEVYKLRTSVGKENKLKIDPTINTETHYNRKKGKRTCTCGCKERKGNSNV